MAGAVDFDFSAHRTIYCYSKESLAILFPGPLIVTVTTFLSVNINVFF